MLYSWSKTVVLSGRTKKIVRLGFPVRPSCEARSQFFLFLRMLSTSTLAEMAEVAVAVSVVVSEGTTLICNGRVVHVASESTLGGILVATGLGGRHGHVLDVRSAVSTLLHTLFRHFEKKLMNKKGRPPVIFSRMKPQSNNFFGAASSSIKWKAQRFSHRKRP